ncbi:MAG: sulfotransferase family 2 domain-containing protein [Luteolibacter sp.]|uniref:sulfotransferase family 2 domain-containing protein n=1 Tax=Luteolibacter sp. TaxID=1962973 RepID=UPI003264C444
MKISANYKFAFLCNPKCGSTSIEKAINPYCESGLGGIPTLKHINAKTFKRHIRPLLRRAGIAEQMETFCIVREPVERVYSWYKYQTRAVLSDEAHPTHQKYTGGISFEQFVEGYISKVKPAYCAKIGTQAGFMNLAKGQLGVDHVFRLDQMDTVAEYLSQKIGKPIVIPHRNASPESTGSPVVKKRRLFDPSSWFGSTQAVEANLPPPEPMELSDELLARLKTYLAADYRIYNNLSGR